jgi:hypothetical protein
MFSPAEQKIVPLSREVAFLLFYRAIAYEKFLKERAKCFGSCVGFWPLFGCQTRILLETVRTVNLLALRLQWFESTPIHGCYRAILQVLKPLGG